MVIGMRPYNFVARDHHKPVVIAGFEPLDIIQSVYMIVKQISEGRAEVENQYARVVRPEGNVKALQAMAQTMELRPFFEWRGLGFITHSALKLRPEFADWDAELRYEVPGLRVADPKACQCGEVLKGVIKPWECKVFGTACTPETPIGTCMVSPEGACAAYFNYGRFSMASERSPHGRVVGTRSGEAWRGGLVLVLPGIEQATQGQAQGPRIRLTPPLVPTEGRRHRYFVKDRTPGGLYGYVNTRQ